MKKLLLVLATTVLVACNNTHNGIVTKNQGFNGSVRTFQTSEGVNCVFAKYGNGGGLSCNWQAFNEKQSY